jgi:hypothetical protein
MTRSSFDVCTDCYFAHHYGARLVDGRWYSGDQDNIPADCEPLTLLAGIDVEDDVDAETDEGYTTFTRAACEGCGSNLGGARWRLTATREDTSMDTSTLPAPEQPWPRSHDDVIDGPLTLGEFRRLTAMLPDTTQVVVEDHDGSWFLNVDRLTHPDEDGTFALTLGTADTFDTRQF